MNLKQLTEPFPPEFIKWRVGSTTKDKSKGMALAYADARAFMDRLDEIVGPHMWQDEYFDSPSGRVFCKVGIKIGDEWVWKADGAGETQVEGEKGAISDAFKRACVKWGLGRYLYDLKSPWVELEQRGRSYVIKNSEYGKLNALLGSMKPTPQQKPQSKRAPGQRQPVVVSDNKGNEEWHDAEAAELAAEFESLKEIEETKGHDMTPPNADTVAMWRGKVEKGHRLKALTVAGMVANAVPYFDNDYHALQYVDFDKDATFTDMQPALDMFDTLVKIGTEKANA